MPSRGSRRVPIAERFWDKVNKTAACWHWTGSKSGKGYGQIGAGGSGASPLLAHRVAWELLRGPIPAGMQIDHLCRNRVCVNPDHMQVVDARTNLLRAPNGMAAVNSQKTHCPKGHLLAGDNAVIYKGARSCRTCKNDRQRERWRAGVRSPSADRRRACQAKTPGRCKCRPIPG